MRRSSNQAPSGAETDDLPEIPEVPAGILTRVSTGAQVEKVSLSKQAEAGRRLAAEMAGALGVPVRVVDVYEDAGISGDGIEERPELERALADVESGRVRLLIAYDVDRLSRDPVQQQQVLRRIARAGARLQFVMTAMEWDEEEGQLTESSEMSFLFKGIQSRLEHRTILRRTRDGRLGVVEAGKQPSRGQDPYGYHCWCHWEARAGRCTEDEVGTYAITPDKEAEAEVVRRIFALVAGWGGAQRHSSAAVCRTLMGEGVVAPGGGMTWYASAIKGIVTNPLYKGQPAWGKTKSRKDPVRKEKGLRPTYVVANDPSRWRPLAECAATVSEDLWQAANDAIEENASGSGAAAILSRRERRYVWSGLLRCPACGGAVSGFKIGSHKGSGVRAYYVCSRALSDRRKSDLDTTSPRCPYGRHFWQVNWVEEHAAAALTAAATRPEFVEAAVRDWARSRAERAGAAGAARERERMVKDRDAAQRRLRSLQEALTISIEAGADVSHLRAQIGAKAAEARQIEAQLAALPEAGKIADAMPSPREAAERVRAMLSRLPEALASPTMEVAEKRYVIEAAILSGTVLTDERRLFAGVQIALRTGGVGVSKPGGIGGGVVAPEDVSRSARGRRRAAR